MGELEDIRRDLRWHFIEQVTQLIRNMYLDYQSLMVVILASIIIWTFVSGFSETFDYTYNCPCSGYSAQSFVGSNYYCESGSVDHPGTETYYFDNPLWDGEGCADDCCNDATQPWFYRQLNEATEDDIEARICVHGQFIHRSVLIDQLELYIQ